MSTPEAIVGFRMSPQQRRLWPLLASGSPAPFVAQCLVAIDPPLEPGRLREALAAVTARHEVLRTTFRLLPGMASPLQVIGDEGAFRLRTEDLADGTPAGRQARLAELVQEARRQPFALEAGPLLDALLVRLAAESQILVLTLPALCADAVGIWSLAREIGAAALGGPAPSEPIQYADVSEIFNRLLESEETRDGREHWARLAASRLAAARQIAAGDGGDGGRPLSAPRTVTVPAEIAAPLLALSAELSAPPAGILLACWQVLLWRSGLAEVPAVAVAHPGRGFEGLEEAIGLFERFLPMAVDLAPDLPFRQFVVHVGRDLAESRERQDYFSWETAPSGPDGTPDLAFLPFAFEQRAPLLSGSAGVSAGGWEIREIHAVTEPFLARLSCVEGGPGLVAALQYDAERLAPWEAERLAARLAALAASAAADSGAALGDLDASGETERHQVLVEWNDTRTELAVQPLHEMFEAQAARDPDGVAVEQEGTRVTYAELAAWSARLARRLRRLGAGPGVVVAVCAERSPALVAGLLGILESGAAYLPLDPDYPPERLAFMLEDAQAPILLAPSALQEALPRSGARWLALDDPGLDEVGTSGRPEGATLADPAYVIYTSGSTGRPKGVVVSHGAIANRLLWMQRRFPLLPSDAVLQKTPVSFDASIWELFLPLATGARLVLARPGGQRDTAYLAAAVADHGITVLQLVPSLLAVFLEEPGIERCAGLRRMFCGGEALAADLVDRFFALLGTELINLYGPTEAAIDATCGPCPPDAQRGVTAPIGRPLDNVRVHLLSEGLRPVPAGVGGELCIGGAGLAFGYLGRSALTAERFIPDPCGGRPGARLYRTGDLARHLPDGTIEFLGRLDHQVKVRGFRIEPGEIEAVLATYPGVRQVVVGVYQGGAGADRLTAWVVPERGADPATGELRLFLEQRLPEHLVPSLFILLEELPRSPSGKLDRRGLPGPGGAHEPLRMGDAPRTLTEQLLAGIWRDLLDIEDIGAEDGFFELGGHSLLATQMISRLRKVFQVELPIRAIFEAPRLRSLADRIEALRNQGRSPHAPIGIASRDVPLPLSFAQQRLWFLSRLDAGSATYNLPMSVRLQGPLDVTALAAAFREITRRHEALRTTFTEDEGRPVQTIGPPPPPELPLADLAGLPEAFREAEVWRLTRREARRPFDLARGPLLRILLLRLGEQEHAALFTMHHIVSDGWSMRILVREITELYRAFTHRLPSPLPDLPVQYADFAAWQRAWLDGEVLSSQIGYWAQQLAGSPPLLELPTDRPRPPRRSGRGDQYVLRFPPGLRGTLDALGRREGGTLFMTLLAAFKAWLYRCTGQSDLVVGTPIANRNQAEIEGLIGFFVNTLVLRTNVAGDPTFRELLGRVREVALGASAHQDLPFERLVELVQPERNLSHTPLFQVMFVFQNTQLAPVVTDDLRLIPIDLHSGTSKFDLTLETMAIGEHLGGVLEYSTDLFDRVTIERMVETLLVLVAGAAADPGRRISELPLLGEIERHQILREWNDTQAGYPAGLLLHELFKAQAGRTPEAPAVIFEESRLSYRELERRSSRLARKLRELGCGPESVVAILMERSVELMVALLGVLEAGAAYLPLDPEYPAERLAWMLGDTAAPVVLTQERLLGSLPPQSAQVLCLEEGWDGEPEAAGGGAAPRAAEDGLAYVIYTSGSTGRPKGVGVSHRGIVNRLLWMQEAYGLTAADRVLQKTPVTFDVSVWELFWPLATGAALVLARPGGHRDSLYLADLIDRAGITVLHFVPSMLQLFLETPDLGRCTGLRLVVASGEALAPELRQRCGERLGGVRLENLYGPTEASVDVTAWSCSAEGQGGTVPIGRPIGNLRVHLVDRELQLVPRGVVGELLIAGVGLGRGYLGRPDLTAERFIPDAWGGVPGERAYRTGDLTRHLSGGEVEYLGRLDNQVKVRGFRIELGEIETTLALHPGVRETVVLARRDPAGEARLVAYVVSAGEPVPGWDELRGFLRERLPDHMVPAAFVVLDALPLTPNGKLDRRALPAPGSHRPELEEEYVPPGNPVEEALAASWAEVLGLERVGSRDNFFVLGGDSMRIVQAISRAQRRGVGFTVQQLYQHQTIRELALVAAVAPPPGEDPPLPDEDEAELALLLAELDGLSEQEVRDRIAERMSVTGLDEVSS